MDNTDSDRDVDSSPDLAKRRNERAYLALYLAINGNIELSEEIRRAVNTLDGI